MIQGQTYNPNEFRGDLPDSIRKVSPDLFVFLRETLQGLRQFNTDALHGALRIPESELTTRYIDEVHPINSKAAIRLATGQTAFAEFLCLPDDPTPTNEGRLIFRRIGREQGLSGVETEFAGIDYTRQGAGRYAWVVYGGYAPIPESLYSGPQPALIGILVDRFSEVPSLKYGTISNDMAFLTPAFGAHGNLDAVALADLLARLAEVESAVAQLRSDIDLVSGLFGSFQVRNLIALSRVESRTEDERLNSVFAEFLNQRSDMLAYGRQIRVEREYLDRVTGNVIAYANASQRETVLAQSFSKDSKFWASVSQDSVLSAQAYSQTSQSSAIISETASVAAGESAAQALTAVSAMASIGAAALTENGGFDTWDVTSVAPQKWEIPIGTYSRVPGFNSPFAMQATNGVNELVYFQQTRETQTSDLLDNLRPGWYVFEISFRLDAGVLNGAGIEFECFDSSNGLLASFAFQLKDLNTRNGAPIGLGTPGQIYYASRLVNLSPPTLHHMRVRVFNNFPIAFEPTAPKTLTWDSVDFRVASEAEIATQTVLTSVVSQVATLNTQVALNVTQLSAQASQLSTLQAQTNLLNSSVASQTNSITLLTSENQAQANSLQALSVSVGNLDFWRATHETRINALANENGAQFSSITTLGTQFNGLSATITEQAESINAVRARYSLSLNVNGAITGIELIGGGGQSAFNIVADRFRIRTSTGDKTPFEVSGSQVRLGTDLHVQNHRIIFDNGTVMRVQGTGFGSSNQFLDWAGPSGNPDAVVETNAIQYLKVDGTAYFGGSLSAGVNTNAGSTTLASATNFVLGPFVSNGGPAQIIAGASAGGVLATDSTTWEVTSPPPDPYAGSRQAYRGTYLLEVSTNDGVTWTTVGDYTVDSVSTTSVVNAGTTGGAEPVPLRRYRHGWQNSLSQTLTQTIAASSTTRVRLTRTGLINLTTGQAVPGNVTTNISLRTVEE